MSLHVGIYGLIQQGDELLVIRKSRGPYKGLFDLPGGRPSFGEPLMDALKREVKEETGVVVNACVLFGNFSFLVPYDDRELYHIALIYRITDADFSGFDSSIIESDVNGSLWMNVSEIHLNDCSAPLRAVLKK